MLFIVALAIAVVPEALPVIASVTLSIGATQLARQQVVVKRLSSLEDLGNITLLCTDKTGTLTEGKMSVQNIMADDSLRLQLFACACLESLDEADARTQNSYDAALLAYVNPEVREQAEAFRQCEALPFDPEARRRRMVIENRQTQTRYLVVIGAVETLLELADCPQQKKEYDLVCDVLQHVFLQLYLSLPLLQSEKPIRGWLAQVTRNRCVDELRRRRLLLFSELDMSEDEEVASPSYALADPDPLPEEVIERYDLQQRLLRAIEALPSRYRRVVLLRYVRQLSFPEIAQQLNLPLGTVKTQFWRAKPLLCAALTEGSKDGG